MAYDRAELERALIRADDAGDTESAAAIAEELAKIKKVDVSNAGKKLASNLTTRRDPAADMTGGERFLAGIGQGLNALGTGAQQRAAEFGIGDLAKANAAAAEQRALDEPLLDKREGFAGSMVGQGLPLAVAPGGSSLAGSVGYGALSGFLQPTLQGESKGVNAVQGGAGGLLGWGLPRVIGRAIQPIRTPQSAEFLRLRNAMEQEGIPLTTAQATNSRPLQIMDAVFGNLPTTAGKQAEIREAQKAAWNNALLRRVGASGDAITPDVLAGARDRLGAQFNGLSSRNNVTVDDALLNRLGEVEQNYRMNLPEDQQRIVGGYLENILNSGGEITGATYQKARSAMGRRANSATDPELRYALKGVQGALDDAARRSVTDPADAALWDQTRRQWGNMKQLQNLMEKPSRDAAAGNASYAGLWSSAKQGNKQNFAFGSGDYSDLARGGQLFLKDVINDSGTAQRAWYQNMLTGNAGAGLLAGAAGLGGYAATGDPTSTAASIGAALLLPRFAQGLIGSRLGQAYLRNRVLADTPGLLRLERYSKELLPGLGAGASAAYLNQ